MKALQLVNWMRVKNYAQLKDTDEKYINVEPLTQMKAMKILFQFIKLNTFFRNQKNVA